MRSFISPSLLLLAAIAGGCAANDAPTTYPVSGTITFDGQPLADGDIVFVLTTPGAAPDAGKIKNGEYSLRAKAGKNRVQITAVRDVPGKTRKGAMGEDLAEREQFIPERYNTATKLSSEVAEVEQNSFDFVLVSGEKANK